MASPRNDWAHPPSAFDFRTDTVTTPISSHLAALSSASLGDDVFNESLTTNAVTDRLAKLFHKPAALFTLSGTMSNQLCLGSLVPTGTPASILCDSRAHIYRYEAGGASRIWGALLTPVTPKNGLYLTLEDVIENAVVTDDHHFASTTVVAVENTINGVVHPVNEVRRIAEWCKEKGIALHIDGARIWEASMATGKGVHEWAELADTVAVCVSKGIGAPVGGWVFSTEERVARMRRLKKMLGGGIRQAGVLTSLAESALNEVWETGKMKETHKIAKRIEKKWCDLGGSTSLPVDTNMVWLDLKKRGVNENWVVEEAEKRGVKATPFARIVVHWQICEEAVVKLEEALVECCKRADEEREKGNVVVDDRPKVLH